MCVLFFKRGSVCCEGEAEVCFSTDSDDATHGCHLSIMLKIFVLMNPLVLLLIGDSSKVKTQKQTKKKEQNEA